MNDSEGDSLRLAIRQWEVTQMTETVDHDYCCELASRITRAMILEDAALEVLKEDQLTHLEAAILWSRLSGSLGF